MRKIVTWEGIHASTLRSQTASKDVLLSCRTGTVPVSEVAVGDSSWSTNKPKIDIYKEEVGETNCKFKRVILFK